MHSLMVPAALIVLNAVALASQAPRLIGYWRKTSEVQSLRNAGLL